MTASGAHVHRVQEPRASCGISWSSEPLTPAFLDAVDSADWGSIDKKMTSSGPWIFKINQQKMESILAPGKPVACRSSLQAALGRRVVLIYFQDVFVGQNPHIEFSLAVNLAGEGVIIWAIRMAGEGVGTEIIYSLARTEGRSGKRRRIQGCPHPFLPEGSNAQAVSQEP